MIEEVTFQFLIDHELERPTKRTTAFVMDKGIGKLSIAQLAIFKEFVVDQWMIVICKCYQVPIEGRDLIAALRNAGHCGY